MRYRKLGKSDLNASVVGLGSEQFGDRAWGYGVQYNDTTINRVIEAAIESGINLFDTAELYGDGKAEILLGNALRSCARSECLIVSKVAPWNLRYARLMKAAERSLNRLRVDSIDLYLVHYPNPLVPIKETFRALEYLVRKGKIRYIGVSNFQPFLIQKAQEALSRSEIIVNEIEYNILSRRAESTVIPYCRRHGIGIMAYSPFAEGILTGRYSAKNLPRDKARAFSFLAKRGFLQRARPLFEVLGDIAKEKKATVAQISLAYVLRDPNFIAIPAALSSLEVRDDARASDIQLSANDILRIHRTAPSLDIFRHSIDNFIYRPITWIKGGLGAMLSNMTGS